jgi:diphosphomevalonate decarboxylase
VIDLYHEELDPLPNRTRSATAVAHPNIAFIKYWGNRDESLNLPANSSLSMTLGGLETRTTVLFSDDLEGDQLDLMGYTAPPNAQERVSRQLDRIRHLAGTATPALVTSENSFPMGAGIASSASSFAALTLAAVEALGLSMDPRELSRLSRLGSGSAARSIFGGFVEWHMGHDDPSSYAEQIAHEGHWSLIDWVVVLDQAHKDVGSFVGHRLANTSPYQGIRIQTAGERIRRCRDAIASRDFEALAEVSELDSDMMHAVMMTSSPPIHYWSPATVRVMAEVRRMRKEGLPVFYTLDAGPNPHCLCLSELADGIADHLRTIDGVRELLRGFPGHGARLVVTPE